MHMVPGIALLTTRENHHDGTAGIARKSVKEGKSEDSNHEVNGDEMSI